MAPTSVIEQASFWDRIPNATSKVALLGRAGCPDERPRPPRPPAAQPSPVRASKRKQSRPARSPANAESARLQCDQGPNPKARRLSLDHHIPARRPLRASVQSRAFRLSFSDDYLRNPHQYVQALINCGGPQLVQPALRPSPSASSRSRRSLGARPRPQPSASSRRGRAGRFHNLQLEQPVATDEQSDNDDANSVTTAASDPNDLADADCQLPDSPMRATSQPGQDASMDATPRANSPLLDLPASDDKHNAGAAHAMARGSTDEEYTGDDDGATDDEGGADVNSGDTAKDEGNGSAPAPAGTGSDHGGDAADDGPAEDDCEMDDSGEAPPAGEESEPDVDHKNASQPSSSSRRRRGGGEEAGAASDTEEDQSSAQEAGESHGDSAGDSGGASEVGDDVDDSGASAGDAPRSPEGPSVAELADPAAPATNNIPSYQRQGQILADGDDVSNIVPQSKRSTVKWTKAYPIEVRAKPMANKLAAAEIHCCSVLRILPEQYLTIKRLLLREGLSRQPPGSFKKRDAQRLCRIDVNKTSKIYEWFVTMGWLPGSDGIYANPPSPAGS
ncbi:hypothetical protein IWQ57_002185 [Coemansia nantahalensis]|uniref:Uncharacterized protein n=1 Tax=Coemansia nantahalensis TaxID=2789366 RepID=A0ACC1K1S2_9FUNG|nr:hypothetical protein IWQ57_002185 [Coemansia nantahalensis]